MKRYLLYSGLVLVLGLVAILTFTQRAQTQSIPENATSETTQVTSSTTPVFSYQGQLLDDNGDPVSNTVPMTFKLYSQATGGTACWTESYTGSNKVVVENGRFSVTLGSTIPINTSCLGTNSSYLELSINNEILTPRQALTDVDSSWKTGYVPNEAQLGQSIVGSDITFDGNIISGRDNDHLNLVSDLDTFPDRGWFKSGWIWLKSVDAPSGAGSVRVHVAKDTEAGNSPFFDIVLIRESGSKTLFDVQDDGHTTIHGNLTVLGNCTASALTNESVAATENTCTVARITEDGLATGAVIELNLLSTQERTDGQSTRFTKGDLQCWSTQTERLEKCINANSRLIMSVASPKGLPIIQGAEPIKVLGSVQAGDILVSSDVAGYAMVNNNPAPGTVIGQALEDFDGESGLIKAMIRKW